MLLTVEVTTKRFDWKEWLTDLNISSISPSYFGKKYCRLQKVNFEHERVNHLDMSNNFFTSTFFLFSVPSYSQKEHCRFQNVNYGHEKG